MASEKPGLRSVLVVGGIVAFFAGVIVGQLLLPVRVPQGLGVPKAPESYPVVNSLFDNAHPVEAVARFSEPGQLISNVGGTVSESSCQAGRPIASGDVIAKINGEPLLALATAMPLWRDLTVGDSGDDVDALRNALAGMGTGVAATGPVTEDLVEAVSQLLGKPATTLAIPVNRFVWIADKTVTPTNCSVVVGQRIVEGDPIADTAGKLTQLEFEWPEGNGPSLGEEQITISGVTVPLEPNGVVQQAESLAELEHAGVVEGPTHDDASSENASRVSAVISLVSPTPALAVAPAALFGVEDSNEGVLACMNDGGEPVAVRVLGSEYGTAYVQLLDTTVPAPTSVSPPIAEMTCGPHV